METRPFGQTGVSFPILSFGAEYVVDAVAESFVPMTGPERLAFFREMPPLVKPENVPWKATDWHNPSEWRFREEPSGLDMWEVH